MESKSSDYLMDISFEERDEAEGITVIIGQHTLADGRKAACMERVHGSYYVYVTRNYGYWQKYPQYEEMAEKARNEITKNLKELVERP